jgi:glycosyltransferase involved in cell wall biosynthesis
MINHETIAVVVPAYNEERQILQVISSMPDFVDRIVVINDCSSDRTGVIVSGYIKQQTPSGETLFTKRRPRKTKYNLAEIVLHDIAEKELEYFIPSQVANENPESDRVILINHLSNGGVGAAIARGYKWCIDHHIDCTAVMAGDGQMDPSELESICRPVIEDGIDYVKGNRLIHRSAWLVMPKTRYIGNAILSILTKIASGYWHVSDTQCGFTAISFKALQAIKIHDIYRSYGMPNDLMVKLNIAFCTIKEVGIKPVYNVGEQSKMRVTKVIPTVSWLLLKSFFKRLWVKYLLKDFHPLFLLYHFSFVLGAVSIPYIIKIARIVLFTQNNVSPLTMLAFVFLFISAFQSLLFAMWMDMQDNERLYK